MTRDLVQVREEGQTVPVGFLPAEPGEYEFACQMWDVSGADRRGAMKYGSRLRYIKGGSLCCSSGIPVAAGSPTNGWA